MQFNSRRGLTWSARMLAQSVGVRVEEDPHATTFAMRRDGTFVTPVLDEDDAEFADLLNGGAVHEIAHYLNSDFAALDAASTIERTFLMIFEDLWCERWAQHRWAGAGHELKAMWQALYRSGKVSRPSRDEEDVLQCVATWVLAHCRNLAVGLDVSAEDADLGRATFVEKFGTDAEAHVDEVFTHLDELASTWDSLNLARRLLKHFVDPANMQDASVDVQHSPDVQEAPEPAGQGQGQGQGGQGGQREQLPPGAENESAATKSSQGAQPADGEGKSLEPGGGEPSGGPMPSTEPLTGEPLIDVPGFRGIEVDGGELAEDAVEDIVCKHGSGTQGSAQVVQMVTADASVISAGEVLISEAQRHSMGVRERVRHLLLTATRESEVIGRRGRLMPTKLWRIRTGNANVFKLHVDGISMSTYVHVLCDASLSMEKRIRTAMQASAAITLSLEGIPGLTTAISAFPNGASACSRLKKESETTQQAGDKLAGQRAAGGTPMAEAILTIKSEMMASMADRKIVFIPCDGAPDNKPKTQLAIRDLERSGVEVVVIGIGVSAEGLAENTLRIDSVGELGGVLFGYLERTFAKVVSKAAA